MKRTCQIGVRADKALRILGEQGQIRYSSLLYALDIRLRAASSFKATLEKLVEANILTSTSDFDPTLSLVDQDYADPEIAREVYEAYKADKRAATIRANEREKAIALILAPGARSMIEDIAYTIAKLGALR